MFLHDFAEVPNSFDTVSSLLVELPALLSQLVGPAFDLSISEQAAPWSISYGEPRPRDDGWVYPVWWPEGRGGLVPAVQADLGFFPRDGHSCHLELMGTYSLAASVTPAHDRRIHHEVVMGARRLLESLAVRLARPAIPTGPVRLDQAVERPAPAPTIGTASGSFVN
jgi:hypothetical protein